jgi:hypothetical protein
MRWQLKPRKDIKQWQRWFAWYPVFDEQRRQLLWLETVLTQCHSHYSGNDWYYKAID